MDERWMRERERERLVFSTMSPLDVHHHLQLFLTSLPITLSGFYAFDPITTHLLSGFPVFSYFSIKGRRSSA